MAKFDDDAFRRAFTHIRKGIKTIKYYDCEDNGLTFRVEKDEENESFEITVQRHVDCDERHTAFFREVYRKMLLTDFLYARGKEIAGELGLESDKWRIVLKNYNDFSFFV